MKTRRHFCVFCSDRHRVNLAYISRRATPVWLIILERRSIQGLDWRTAVVHHTKAVTRILLALTVPDNTCLRMREVGLCCHRQATQILTWASFPDNDGSWLVQSFSRWILRTIVNFFGAFPETPLNMNARSLHSRPGQLLGILGPLKGYRCGPLYPIHCPLKFSCFSVFLTVPGVIHPICYVFYI